jgi:hypothetical protein
MEPSQAHLDFWLTKFWLGKNNVRKQILHFIKDQESKYLNKFSLGYVHDTEVFIMTIPIRLILYISYIVPVIFPPQSLPNPT